jgi:hypothetical protein
MNTSIQLRYQLTLKLIELLRDYAQYLFNQFVSGSRQTLETALYNGLPRDVHDEFLQRYQVKNEADARVIVSILTKECIPYLEDVAIDLLRVMDDYVQAIPKSSGQAPLSDDISHTVKQVKEGIGAIERMLLEKNNRDLELALGIKQGLPMDTGEADRQNANPQYGYGAEYGVNCATCAAAYVLRKRGFDVKAKGNPVDREGNPLVGEEGNYNYLLSVRQIDIWKNLDGTIANPTTVTEWMDKNGKRNYDGSYSYMTKSDYMAFFEETCKEKGIYILTLEWERSLHGHATILQRDENGVLYYIEPQVYENTVDGRRSIDDLFKPKQHLAFHPSSATGILRVDDKNFDARFASLFYI